MNNLCFKKDKIGYVFLATLIIITLFALGDYLLHSLSAEYSVPSYYFVNKFIFGTLIIFMSYLLVCRKNIWVKSLFISVSTSTLLQIRYFLEGYPLKFVLLFLFFHFLMLIPSCLLAFYFLRKKLKINN